jgi:drug/metabolite transporter superfamily protein YnfA
MSAVWAWMSDDAVVGWVALVAIVLNVVGFCVTSTQEDRQG